MSVLNAPGLTDALGDERLLDPEQYGEFVGAMLPVCQDVPILAKELVYRGWLTPYQLEQILAGHGPSLILGSYVLLEPIGEGGMGRVFRARNWKLNRVVAVKVIREEQARQPSVVARFQREIRALGRVNHPNIVQAVDADFRPGRTYYAMEYVAGADLGQYVRRHGPLPVAEACDYVMQTADALQHACELGLTHRDIKPGNLLLADAGRVVKVLDLGLTRLEIGADDSAFAELTRVGAVIGTPDFMAPEQVVDSRSADVRSDLYSLGCTFYYLLAGREPFAHVEAVVDKLYAQCEEEPPAVEALRPDLPPAVVRIVRQLMAKRRRDRFQSPAELFEALRPFAEGVVLPSGDTVLEAQAVTLTDVPALPYAEEAPATQVLAADELGLVVSPPDEDVDEPDVVEASPGSGLQTRILIAVLLATLALLLLAQAGFGPRIFQARAASAESAQPAAGQEEAPTEE
jgi:serine/threonine protein kinase